MSIEARSTRFCWRPASPITVVLPGRICGPGFRESGPAVVFMFSGGSLCAFGRTRGRAACLLTGGTVFFAESLLFCWISFCVRAGQVRKGEQPVSISASQLRRGSVIVHGGAPCRVIESQHIKPGKGPAYMQSKLRNLHSGVIFEHRFRAADQLERAVLQTHELQYLYSDGMHYHFMNTENFEMLAIDEEALGDAAKWLIPELVIQAEFYDNKPIGVQLPTVLELKVEETEPAARGDTKTTVTKPARLENGVTIQVPPFVNEGETIRVDPRESKYLERARS